MTEQLEPKAQVNECADALIVMLDVLGARTDDIARARSIAEVVTDWYGYAITSSAKFGEVVVNAEPHVTLVGDCLLLRYPLSGGDMALPLWWLSGSCFNFLVPCLAQHVPVRGAIARGAAVWSDSVTLGPAIAEAVTWYEKPQVFTAVATPALGSEIAKMVTDGGPGSDEAANWFVPYDVPLKDGATKEMWALRWPDLMLAQSGDDREVAETDLQKWLEACPRDADNEAKYANTLEFARYCWSVPPPAGAEALTDDTGG